jgi:hypothetical protein
VFDVIMGMILKKRGIDAQVPFAAHVAEAPLKIFGTSPALRSCGSSEDLDGADYAKVLFAAHLLPTARGSGAVRTLVGSGRRCC